MTKKPTAKTQSSWGQYASKFVSVSLTDEDKVACKAWHFDETMWMNFMNEMIAQGYKFTTRNDTSGSGYVVWMSTTTEDHVHKGWMLSGRGSSILKAFKQLAFIHFKVLGEDWRTNMVTKQSDTYDD